MSKAVALPLAAGLFAIAVLVGVGSVVARSSDNPAGSNHDQAAGTLGRSFDAASAAQAKSLDLDLLEPATKQRRGVFTTRAGEILEVFEGERSRAFDDVDLRATKGVRRCVSAVSAGFNTMACRPAPLFLDSDVLFVESWSGGPEASQQSSYALAGIASPQVTRIEAVTTDTALMTATLSEGHAFLVELPDEQVRAGVTLTTLNVYGHGELLRRIDLPD